MVPTAHCVLAANPIVNFLFYPPRSLAVNLTDLDPGFDYTVWVRGVTFAAGQSSNVTHVSLAGHSISTAPANLKLTLIEDINVNVSWSAPTKAKGVLGYVVFYWPVSVTEDEERSLINVTSPGKTWAMVRDLTPVSWYAIALGKPIGNCTSLAFYLMETQRSIIF